MDGTFKIKDKIGNIVAQFPQASNIFLEYKIDFCCGGDRTLELAIKEQNLDSSNILRLLNESYNKLKEENKEFINWVNENPGRLMDYIIANHHEYLNKELPIISELILKILKVHGRNHQEVYRIHKLFNKLRVELEEHLIEEEQIVFPMIKEYKGNSGIGGRENLLSLISKLETEHTGAGDIIKELREVANHYIVPKGVCKTFELTYKKLMELEKNTFDHIHLENNILFKNI